MIAMTAFLQAQVPQPAAKAGGQRSPVAPSKAQIQSVVDEAYAKIKDDTEGKNADYIPALAQVDSKLYGVAVVSTDGQMVTAGDVNHPFSIQSISKVYSLALAIEEMGPKKVFKLALVTFAVSRCVRLAHASAT
jgi:glutaminase